VGLLLLVYGFTRVEEAGFSFRTIGILGLAVGATLAFFAVEARVANPLMPLHVWRRGSLTGSCLVSFALTATTGSAAVIGTLYLQNVLDYSPTATGLAYAPFSLAVVIGSLVGARFVSRIGLRSTMVAGLVLVSLAMAVSSRMGRKMASHTFSRDRPLRAGAGRRSRCLDHGGDFAVAENERGLASAC
jgi:predicted MFS family arabinose efflux permease